MTNIIDRKLLLSHQPYFDSKKMTALRNEMAKLVATVDELDQKDSEFSDPSESKQLMEVWAARELALRKLAEYRAEFYPRADKEAAEGHVKANKENFDLGELKANLKKQWKINTRSQFHPMLVQEILTQPTKYLPSDLQEVCKKLELSEDLLRHVITYRRDLEAAMFSGQLPNSKKFKAEVHSPHSGPSGETKVLSGQEINLLRAEPLTRVKVLQVA